MAAGNRFGEFIFRRHDTGVGAPVRFHRFILAVMSLTVLLLLVLKGPFLTFTSWISMFADWRTRQTIIHSRNAVYILPSLIDGNGKPLSVAELIASGQASFSSNGDQTSGSIDMARFFNTNPCSLFIIYSSFYSYFPILC